MRSFLGLAALLFAGNAYACPNLTGTYTCTYQDGSSEIIEISKMSQNGVTVYDYNGSTVSADNVVYPVPDDETLKQGTFRAWCEGMNLKAELKGKYFHENTYYGDLTMLMDFTLTGSDLHQITTGNLKNAGGEYPLDSEMTCVRN
jgi:hypothetical protein